MDTTFKHIIISKTLSYMKRFITFLLLIFVLDAPAFAQSDLYKICEKEKSITSVYISKAMLQLVGEGEMGSIDNGAMVLMKEKIDNVLILNADNPAGVKFLRGLRAEFMSNKDRAILMQINEPISDVVMFRLPMGEKKNQYAISVLGKNYATMIVVEGILTLDDFARATSGFGGKDGMKIMKK